MIRILELFGGIGACSKALERLGIDYEIADYVEIDKYAVMSFNAIHNTNFSPQDICNWDKDIDVDLIMHGSPCQDFSLAGKQAGGDENSGTRSSLMYETLRIVEKLKPKYVLWENVKNIISKNHKHNFDNYIERMNGLGYHSYYQVLNAKDYGIPQNRERVFTVSIRNDIDVDFKFPPKMVLNKKLKDMLETDVDEKYFLSDKMIKYISADNEKWTGNNKESIINKTCASTINTNEGSRRCDASNYISSDVEENYNLKNQLCDKLLEENLIKENDVIRHSYSNDRMKNFRKQSINNDLSPTLDTRCDCLGIAIKNNTKKGYLVAHEGDGIYTNTSTKRGTVQKDMIQTLTTFQDKGVVVKDSVYSDTEEKLFTEEGNIKRYINSDVVDEFKEGQMATTSFPNGYGHGPRTHNESIALNTIDKPSVKQNLRIRKLTPKECWRLMGFDDEDYEKASKVCSNAQLYKQAGNSIVVNVLEKLLKELMKEVKS